MYAYDTRQLNRKIERENISGPAALPAYYPVRKMHEVPDINQAGVLLRIHFGEELV